MSTPENASPTPSASRRQLWPLYAAGFTTAFGAHGIAANLGAAGQGVSSLLTLGVLLALYDGAEVLLKPVFGSLAAATNSPGWRCRCWSTTAPGQGWSDGSIAVGAAARVVRNRHADWAAGVGERARQEAALTNIEGKKALALQD